MEEEHYINYSAIPNDEWYGPCTHNERRCVECGRCVQCGQENHLLSQSTTSEEE